MIRLRELLREALYGEKGGQLIMSLWLTHEP